MKIRLGLCLAAAALAMALGGPVARADEQATAQIALTSVSGPTFNYTITLHNTGTVDIGTFWYAWLPSGEDLLNSTPTPTDGPGGWFSYATNGGGSDGYGIEWYNYYGSPISAGDTATFSFSSPDNLAAVTGSSAPYPGTPAGTSEIYNGGAFSDAGFQLVVAAPVPEPASVALVTAGAIGLVMRRRILAPRD